MTRLPGVVYSAAERITPAISVIDVYGARQGTSVNTNVTTTVRIVHGTSKIIIYPHVLNLLRRERKEKQILHKLRVNSLIQ